MSEARHRRLAVVHEAELLHVLRWPHGSKSMIQDAINPLFVVHVAVCRRSMSRVFARRAERSRYAFSQGGSASETCTVVWSITGTMVSQAMSGMGARRRIRLFSAYEVKYVGGFLVYLGESAPIACRRKLDKLCGGRCLLLRRHREHDGP